MLPEHLDGLQKGMRRASKVIVPDNGGAVGAITCIWSGLALASRPGERSISGTYLCVLRRPIKCSILLISGGEGLGRMGGGSSDASPYFRIVFSWWLHVGVLWSGLPGVGKLCLGIKTMDKMKEDGSEMRRGFFMF